MRRSRYPSNAPPLVSLLESVRRRPFRWTILAAGFWLGSAVLIDALGGRWTEGPQVVEFLGGVLGLPLTGIVVVIGLDRLERLRWASVAAARRRRVRERLQALERTLTYFYLSPDPRAVQERSRIESGDLPLIRTGALSGYRSSSFLLHFWQVLLVIEPSGNPYFAELNDFFVLADFPPAPSRFVSPEERRTVHEAAVIVQYLTRPQHRSNEAPVLSEVSIDVTQARLEDLKSLAEDPVETTNLDEILVALRSWREAFVSVSASNARFARVHDDAHTLAQKVSSGAEPVSVASTIDAASWGGFGRELWAAHRLLGVLDGFGQSSSTGGGDGSATNGSLVDELRAEYRRGEDGGE